MKVLASALALPLLVLVLGSAPEGDQAAAKEEAKQEVVKCPISGEPVKDDIALNVNGELVKFCCKNCSKKYLEKIRFEPAKEQKCVLSGRAADPTKTVIHKTVELIQFCCGNCKAKWADQNKIAFNDGTGKCPLSGKPGKEETAIVVNGEKVVFCCENCKAKYTKTNFGELKAKDEGKCPLSGNAGKEETAQIYVTAKEVPLCCGNCQKKYIADHIKKDTKDEKKAKEEKETAAKEPTVRTS